MMCVLPVAWNQRTRTHGVDCSATGVAVGLSAELGLRAHVVKRVIIPPSVYGRATILRPNEQAAVCEPPHRHQAASPSLGDRRGTGRPRCTEN
nr:MAG TPA: hypothetical protein [Caudoviricetes sp.]